MATLEKIRSKSVLLIVIIGVALLAFIVGDALTNSRNLFGDHTTVAKVGGSKIDISEYQQKREELNRRLEEARQQNPQQFANFDTQVLAQMAIDELIGTRLLDESVEKLGIRTSPEQLRFYVLENPVNQQGLSAIMRQLQAVGVNVTTPAQAYDVIFNPTRNGLTEAQAEPFKRAWVAMEQETARMIKRNTYQRLVYSTVKANDLDRKALYNDFVNTRNVTMAYRPYGNLDAKKYPVSASELQTAYETDKNMFRVDELTKDVSLITVNIAPSAADRKASSELAKKTVAALSDSAATISPAIKKEGVVAQRKHVKLSDVPAGAAKEFISSAANGNVSLIYDNFRGFEIVKMGKRSMEVDSIQLNLVQVAGRTLPSKVLARLNGGLSVDSISKSFSPDSVMAQKEMWIPMFTADGPTNALDAAKLDSLSNAGGRFITLDSSDQGAILAQVVKRTAPVEVVEFEQFEYVLNPSAKTVDEAYSKLEKFLAANSNAEQFNKNAEKAGYNVQRVELTQSVPAIQSGYRSYLPESRQVVRWAMIDGEPGEVSKIFENKNANVPMLYVAAVNSEYDDFRPLQHKDVTDMLTEKVRREKAGKAMAEQYRKSGKDIATVARAMSVEPTDMPSFRFGRNGMIPAGAAMGKVSGTKPGKNVVVVYDDNGVYAFVVNGTNKESFPYNADSYDQQYYQFVNPDFNAMLRGSKKIVNNAYKFEGGE